jgi:hypothetical protein
MTDYDVDKVGCIFRSDTVENRLVIRVKTKGRIRFSSCNKLKPIVLCLWSSRHFLLLPGTSDCSTWLHTAFRIFRSISDSLTFFPDEFRIQRFTDLKKKSFRCNLILLYSRIFGIFADVRGVFTELHQNVASLKPQDTGESYPVSAFSPWVKTHVPV